MTDNTAHRPYIDWPSPRMLEDNLRRAHGGKRRTSTTGGFELPCFGKYKLHTKTGGACFPYLHRSQTDRCAWFGAIPQGEVMTASGR